MSKPRQQKRDAEAAVRPATPEVPPPHEGEVQPGMVYREQFGWLTKENAAKLSAPAAPDAAARLTEEIVEKIAREVGLRLPKRMDAEIAALIREAQQERPYGKEPRGWIKSFQESSVPSHGAAEIGAMGAKNTAEDVPAALAHTDAPLNSDAQESSKEVMPSENQRLDTVEGESRAEPQEKTSAGNTGLCAYEFHDGSLCSHPKNSILHEPFVDGCHLYVAPQPTSAGNLTAEEFNNRELGIQWTNPISPTEIYQFAEAFHAAASAEMDDSQLLREERDIFKEDNIKQYAECEKLEAEVRELRELLAKTKSWIHPSSTLFAEIESVLGKG